MTQEASRWRTRLDRGDAGPQRAGAQLAERLVLAGEVRGGGQRHVHLQQAQLQHRRRARERAAVAGLAAARGLLHGDDDTIMLRFVQSLPESAGQHLGRIMVARNEKSSSNKTSVLKIADLLGLVG